MGNKQSVWIRRYTNRGFVIFTIQRPSDYRMGDSSVFRIVEMVVAHRAWITDAATVIVHFSGSVCWCFDDGLQSSG